MDVTDGGGVRSAYSRVRSSLAAARLSAVLLSIAAPFAAGQSGSRPHWATDGAVRLITRSIPFHSMATDQRAWDPALEVQDGSRRYLVPLSRHVGTYYLDSATALDVKRRGDTLFVLADVSGPPPRNEWSNDGCPVRSRDLVWLKLSGGRLLERRSAPYQGCWLQINSAPGERDRSYRVEGDSLWFDGVARAGFREVSIRYHAADPVGGLKSIVDTAPRPEMPRYPRPLADRNVEGEVVVRFPVRYGLALTEDSVIVLRSSHPLFSLAVARTIAAWSMERAYNPVPEEAIGFYADSVTRFMTARFHFAMRHDRGCGRTPPPSPASLPMPVGERARVISATRREVVGQVEVCPAPHSSRATGASAGAGALPPR